MYTLETQNDIAHPKMLVGVFHDRVSSENAFNELYERGYEHDDVNLIMTEDTQKKHFSDEDSEIGTKAAEGLGKGSVIGGSIGALAGIVAALGTSILIPGLGIVIAGPIAIGIAGAGVGGLTGGIIGTLIGAGIPEEHAKTYEDGIKKGDILICVNPRTKVDAEYFDTKWRDTNSQRF